MRPYSRDVTEGKDSRRIVMAMVTYRSAEKVGRELFLKCLTSGLQVPYHAIILVDDSPTDKTKHIVKEFAEKYGKELIIEKSRLYGYHKSTRATARQTAIDIFLENFDDEWLFFQDDDAFLKEGWWQEAEIHVADPKVGLVWGIEWDPTTERQEYLKSIRIDYREYLVKTFMARGGLHDTLLRRKAIEGIKIPPELHMFEDGYVKWWVECHGWDLRILETGIIHYNTWKPEYMKHSLRDLAEAVKVAWRYGIVSAVFADSDFYQEYRNLLRPALGVLMPIASFFLFLPNALKTVGLKAHFMRQWSRFKIRIAMLWTRLQIGPPPHPCDSIR